MSFRGLPCRPRNPRGAADPAPPKPKAPHPRGRRAPRYHLVSPRFGVLFTAPQLRGPRCIGRPRAVLLALSVVEGRSSASDRATFGGSRCGGSQPQAAPSLISGPGLLFPVEDTMRLCLNSNPTRKPKQPGFGRARG